MVLFDNEVILVFTGLKENLLKVIEYIREEYAMSTAHINAVYSEDMEEFLDSLGILDEIRQGRKACYFCHKNLNIEEIQSVFPFDGDIQLCCNSVKCNSMFARKVDS